MRVFYTPGQMPLIRPPATFSRRRRIGLRDPLNPWRSFPYSDSPTLRCPTFDPLGFCKAGLSSRPPRHQNLLLIRWLLGEHETIVGSRVTNSGAIVREPRKKSWDNTRCQFMENLLVLSDSPADLSINHLAL